MELTVTATVHWNGSELTTESGKSTVLIPAEVHGNSRDALPQAQDEDNGPKVGKSTDEGERRRKDTLPEGQDEDTGPKVGKNAYGTQP